MSIDLNIKSLNQSILIDLLAKSKIIFSAEECKLEEKEFEFFINILKLEKIDVFYTKEIVEYGHLLLDNI
jgi:hypothetical protein